MSHVVTNEQTQEVAAIFDDTETGRDLAIKFAERLALQASYRERWVVTQTVVIHETRGVEDE